MFCVIFMLANFIVGLAASWTIRSENATDSDCVQAAYRSTIASIFGGCIGGAAAGTFDFGWFIYAFFGWIAGMAGLLENVIEREKKNKGCEKCSH